MKTLRTALTVILLLLWTGAAAQDPIEKLREQIRQYKQQLEATNTLLGKNRDNINLSERELKLVRNNISTRKNIVKNLDQQTALITAEINANTRQVRELDQQLETLKKEYGDFVYSAWKNHKMNNATVFLFASRDFNDATRRMDHMKRYNRMREQRGAEIDSLNYILQYEIEKLNVRKTELDEARQQRNSELASLTKEEKQHSSALGSLRSNRKKLETQAREHQRRIAGAQKQIDRIIAEQTKSQKGRSQEQIEKDIILSGRFEDNKGSLPWPVSGGVVIDAFGQHGMSSQPDIENDFKGVNIAGQRNSQVKAVFEGEVTGVYNIDKFNNCVTVRSGDYIILYANMGRTSVRTGQKVAINQEIGRLYDTDDADQHMLIFQIWHDTKPINPEEWLRR